MSHMCSLCGKSVVCLTAWHWSHWLSVYHVITNIGYLEKFCKYSVLWRACPTITSVTSVLRIINLKLLFELTCWTSYPYTGLSMCSDWNNMQVMLYQNMSIQYKVISSHLRHISKKQPKGTDLVIDNR